MAWIIGKIKCCFCGSVKGVIHSVHGYGMYASDVSSRTFYHDECLQMIELNPEKYGHKMADMAIFIHELKERNLEENISIKTSLLKRNETLQQKHFERMMPKKS